MAVSVYQDRKDIPEEYTWNLKDIFLNDEEWEKEYISLKEKLNDISGYMGKLGESSKILLQYFKFSDEIDVRLSKVYGYSNLKSDQDTADSRYITMRGKAVNLYVEFSGAMSFVRPEISSIPEETIKTFFSECPELKEYERVIYLIRREIEHTLSPECERILALSGEMSEGAENIYSSFMDTDVRFQSVKDSKGNEHELTNGTYVHLLESSDRTLRENAFKCFYSKMGEYKNTIAASFDANFKKQKFYSSARNFDSMLEASLFSHEVPVSVYTSLIDSVHNNLEAMYKYVALRKKILGVEELHMFDVYTPIVKDADREISYEEAKNTVIKALSVLGPDYIGVLKEGFENRWIDVYENKGKRSGAYSSGSSRPHPYVLLNHKDNLDCLFTIAHEMGHSLHSYYSEKNQNISTSDYVIFVAEVASTVNEVLTMKYLLSKSEDNKEKAFLINHFLDQFKGTIYRQTMFAEFEKIMAELCENNEALTSDILCEKYLELNKLYFGKDMVSDDEISLEWARIPHFFYNFYVFQYATGFSAAVAIAERILNEGENAVKDYIKFLSSGSSMDPISLLKIAGVDMSSPEPVNAALTMFDELVNELESIINN